MKKVILLFLAFAPLFLAAQEYGAESYWQQKKREDGVKPPLTASEHLEKAGSLMLSGDLVMLGSALTIPFIFYGPNIEEYNSKSNQQTRNALTIVAGAGVLTGYIMKLCGYNHLRKAGRASKKTALLVNENGLTLALKF